MPMDSNLTGFSGTVAEVNSLRHLRIVPETSAASNPGNVGAIRSFSEIDQGVITGAPLIVSPEADVDYRLRVSQDLLLDEVIFNYTTQDTGKHLSAVSTIASAWTVGNFTTNSGNVANPAAGSFSGIATYATFPNTGTQTLSADFEASFSAQPVTNVFVEIGFAGSSYVPSAAAPTDGLFFRISSAGVFLVGVNAGTETALQAPLTGGSGIWTYVNSKKYQFITYLGGVVAQLWVNDGTGSVLLVNMPLPAAQGRICSSQGMRFFCNQRVVGGAAGGAFQAALGAYNIRLGGSNLTSSTITQGNRLKGSYQGSPGSAQGSLATYPNSTNPTAAAPVNTALTANLPAGLGGQGAVVAAAASATDGIWGNFQIPTASISTPGQRLVVQGVVVDLINMGAAVATTPTTVQFSLAFGHTNVNLATAEGPLAKSPRRILLGFATWAVGAAIGAQPQAGQIRLNLGDAVLYVNPGENIALVGKFLNGTATASQVINFTWQPIFGWE